MVKRWNKVLTSLFLLTIIMLPQVAQTAVWQPLINHYTPADYNGGTQNWQIIEQENGWIYAANNYGLLEYDGYNWRLYGLSNSSAIRSIEKGDNGQIFAGGRNDFGVFSPVENGRIAYQSFIDSIPTSYRNFGEVWQLHYDDRTLYIQTHHYIFVRNSNGHIDVINPAALVYTSILHNHSFYVATSQGIFVYTGGRLNALNGSDLLRNKVIAAMCSYGDNEILIATDFHGIYRYNGSNITPFITIADPFLQQNQLYSIVSNDDFIACGTVLHGLVIMDRNGHHPQYIDRENGLQNSTILCLYYDKAGNLWVGQDQGIDLLQTGQSLRILYDSKTFYGSGYTYLETHNIRLYGTNQGVYYSPFYPDDAPLQFVDSSQGQVWRLRQIDGTIFCCHNRGLFELNTDEKGTISMLKHSIDDGVWDIFAINNDNLIVCTYSGYYLVEKRGNKWQAERQIRGFYETTLYSQYDKFGKIWGFSSHGIERLTLDSTYSSVTSELIIPQASPISHSICRFDDDIYITSAGTIAVVTQNGMESDPKIEALSGKKRYVYIGRDSSDNLFWIADNRLLIRRYDRALQLYDNDVTEIIDAQQKLIGGFPNIVSLADGTSIIGGINGFYLYDSSFDKSLSTSQPHIYIRNVTIDRIGEIYGESAIDSTHKSLELKHSTYNIHLNFCCSDISQNPTRWRTRLLNEEQEFSAWGRHPERNLFLTKSGTYTLQICALTSEGTEIYDNFIITILPPWYFTWWAIILWTSLSLLLIALIAYASRYHIEQKRKLMEQDKDAEIHKHQMRILQLENEQAVFDLKTKGREMNNMLLNQVSRNELISSVLQSLRRITDSLQQGDLNNTNRLLQQLQSRLTASTHEEKDWKRFEDNIDLTHDRFAQKLTATHPWLSTQEKKLCIYIYMGLQTKEIAPLMNISVRGVEQMRYRIRKRMQLNRTDDMRVYFEQISVSN